jgi:hypothetical protein
MENPLYGVEQSQSRRWYKRRRWRRMALYSAGVAPLVRWVVGFESLIEKYIKQDRYHPDVADARVMPEGVPVWALIGYLPVVGGHHHKVATAYRISDEAMDAAVAYYRQHQCEIDARIEANAAPV